MKIFDTFKRGLNVVKLDAVEKSPELLIGIGVISVIAGAVVACKQTLKVQEMVIEPHNELLEEINETVGKVGEDEDGNEVEYTEEDAKQDKIKLYTQTGLKVAWNYALPAGLIIFGVVSILCSHKIMKNRNMALLASYNALDLALRGYRERVKKVVGEQEEYDLFHNVQREKVMESYIDENGEEKWRETEVVTYDEDTIRDHNTYQFGPGNPNYNPDPSISWWTLKEIRKSLNTLLHMKGENGYLTKGDALAMLGLKDMDPYVSEQTIFGWVNDGNTEIDIEIDPNFGSDGRTVSMIRLNARPIQKDLRNIENRLLGRKAA